MKTRLLILFAAILALAGCRAPTPVPAGSPFAPQPPGPQLHCASYDWLPPSPSTQALGPGHRLGAQLIINDGPGASTTPLAGDVTGTAGASVVSAISGSTPILITPNVVEWTKGTATPTLTQATPTSDVAPPNITISPASPYASASVHVVGGSINVKLPAPLSGTTYSTWGVSEVSTSLITIGTDQFSRAVLSAPTQNMFVSAPGGYIDFSADGGAGTLYNDANTWTWRAGGSTTVVNWTSTQAQFGIPLTGYSNGTTSGLQLASTATPIACGTAGGTQTISSAQASTPGLVVTSGVLTANCTLAFATNGSLGVWLIDLGSVTTADLASFSLVFSNGSASVTLTQSKLTALQATGATGVVVYTYGSNTIVLK